MTDSVSERRLSHTARGIEEFTYRFLTVMLDAGLMTVAEVLEFNVAVGDALEFGRRSPDLVSSLQSAMERAEKGRID